MMKSLRNESSVFIKRPERKEETEEDVEDDEEEKTEKKTAPDLSAGQ